MHKHLLCQSALLPRTRLSSSTIIVRSLKLRKTRKPGMTSWYKLGRDPRNIQMQLPNCNRGLRERKTARFLRCFPSQVYCHLFFDINQQTVSSWNSSISCDFRRILFTECWAKKNNPKKDMEKQISHWKVDKQAHEKKNFFRSQQKIKVYRVFHHIYIYNFICAISLNRSFIFCPFCKTFAVKTGRGKRFTYRKILHGRRHWWRHHQHRHGTNRAVWLSVMSMVVVIQLGILRIEALQRQYSRFFAQ